MLEPRSACPGELVGGDGMLGAGGSDELAPGRRLAGGDHPAERATAEAVEDHLEVEVGPFGWAPKFGDIPRLQLVGASGQQFGFGVVGDLAQAAALAQLVLGGPGCGSGCAPSRGTGLPPAGLHAGCRGRHPQSAPSAGGPGRPGAPWRVSLSGGGRAGAAVANQAGPGTLAIAGGASQPQLGGRRAVPDVRPQGRSAASHRGLSLRDAGPGSLPSSRETFFWTSIMVSA